MAIIKFKDEHGVWHEVDTIVGPKGENGKSPYVGDNGNWYEWSDDQQGYVDTGVSASGIFWAVYNVTTLAQIAEVYDNGQTICVKYNDNIFTLTHIENLSSVGSAVFVCHLGGRAEKIVLSRNGADEQWGSTTSFIVPTALADLTQDSTHRTVTDTEKTAWSNSGVFYCQKDVTPYADMLAAHNSGKLCVAIVGYSVYTATEFSGGMIWFENFYRGANRRYYVTSAGTWHSQYEAYQTKITDLSDIRSNAFAGKIASDKLDYLVPYIKGQMWMFETDVVSAGSQTAPAGARMASVNAIGMQAVRYNQLIPLTSKPASYGITFGWNASEQRFRVTGTATGSFSTFALVQPTAGSKYYLYIDSENTDVGYRFANAQPNTRFGSSGIFSCTSSTGNRFGINDGLVPGQTYDFGLSMFVVDLTAMFGAGNEPTTKSDPRIAWLDGYLTRNVAYNAGTLITADAEKVKYGATEQTIPAAVRVLPGYGLGLKDAPNELVRTDGGWKYIQRVEAGAAEGDLPTPLAESVETDITMLMGTALDPQMIAAGNKVVIGDEDMLTSSTVEYMVKVEEALS